MTEESQARPVQDENISVAVTDHVDAGTLADGLQPGEEPLKAFSWRDCRKKSFSDNIKHLPLSGVILPNVQLDLFPAMKVLPLLQICWSDGSRFYLTKGSILPEGRIH